MSRNPYAPPGSVVAYDESVRVKPVAMRRAVFLMWASFALNLVIVAIDWKFLVTQSSLPIVVISELIGVGIAVWLILKISVGRNWARIVYLVLLAIGLPVVVPEIMSSADRAAHVAGLKMIELGLDIGTMYLVFFPGREWFRKREQAAGS